METGTRENLVHDVSAGMSSVRLEDVFSPIRSYWRHEKTKGRHSKANCTTRARKRHTRSPEYPIPPKMVLPTQRSNGKRREVQDWRSISIKTPRSSSNNTSRQGQASYRLCYRSLTSQFSVLHSHCNSTLNTQRRSHDDLSTSKGKSLRRSHLRCSMRRDSACFLGECCCDEIRLGAGENGDRERVWVASRSHTLHLPS